MDNKEKKTNSKKKKGQISSYLLFLFLCDISKFVFIMNTDCHLYTLMQTESDDDNETSSDESDIEVISIVDETDIISISTNDHSAIEDDAGDGTNEEEEKTVVQQSSLTLNSNDPEPDEGVDDLNNSTLSTDQSSLSTSSLAISNSVEESPLCKRKRRQWSTAEKLRALDMLEKANGNKMLTAAKEGCSRYQLSQWQKQKADLLQLSKQNHGTPFFLALE